MQGHVRVETSRDYYKSRLENHLKPYGYVPVRCAPGLWKHTQKGILFTPVVENFAIKYTSQQDTNHLMEEFRDKYTIFIDWDESLYIGITLNWDYQKRKGTLSMPNTSRSHYASSDIICPPHQSMYRMNISNQDTEPKFNVRRK